MLHAAFVRSPHAHARIVAVRKPQGYEKRVSAPQTCAASARCARPQNCPASSLPIGRSWPPARCATSANRSRWRLARRAAEAEDLAALVEVDFEPLPPVVTMADALKKSPPFVHDEWGDNVLVDIKLEAGDLNAAKAAAAHVVERRFRMNRMHPLPLEGRACVASYDSRLDELVVYVAHQLPVPLADRIGASARHQPAPAARGRAGRRRVFRAEDLCRKRNRMRGLGGDAASPSGAMDSGSLRIAGLRRHLPRLPVQGDRLCRCAAAACSVSNAT